eukprot:CAMPEP_0116085844 /NCGR_PEP_ID=MMETSP0327-20121206/4537_1 /TAXON_ID=44447 /ORGANISM="Pseudo-nitzschia delicatissima, Strain B596" /LENGTH=261 /DNA_ID=CAMNT_0003576853 /DNA_START=56 /DNA_END=838 /DNA_ORIENTATION=+
MTSEKSTKRKNRGDATDAPSKKTKREKNNKPPSTNGKSSGSKNKDDSDFSMLKLGDIKSKLEMLCKKVPAIPEGNFILNNGNDDDENGNKSEPKIDETATREWAAQLQVVLEEFNLYICCAGTATYKWGTERSGAGDQNLSLLIGEMSSSQEQISTAVTPRLTNLLAPVVDLVIEKTVTYKQEMTINTTDKESTHQEPKRRMTEVKENHFTRKLVDPSFLSLCHKILARNAPLLRRVVLSNFHKILAAMRDFLKAQENDMQ